MSAIRPKRISKLMPQKAISTHEIWQRCLIFNSGQQIGRSALFAQVVRGTPLGGAGARSRD